MAENKIYVQGSYIDIHDNENVYLSVDKAQVNMGQKAITSAVDRMDVKVPDILLTDKAKKYWQRLLEAGFVDANYQLLSGTTRKQAMYIAEIFAQKLGINSKWKTFEQFWGISNLAQEKWDFQQTGIMPTRSKDIDKIFED